jgi:hypothetical protein
MSDYAVSMDALELMMTPQPPSSQTSDVIPSAVEESSVAGETGQAVADEGTPSPVVRVSTPHVVCMPSGALPSVLLHQRLLVTKNEPLSMSAKRL